MIGSYTQMSNDDDEGGGGQVALHSMIVNIGLNIL